MLPCITKRRITTNLKTINNQKCQKIKLHGSLTTKELKKKYSLKLVGGAETGSQGREDSWKGGGWWTRWSHICVQINWEEQLGSKTDPQPWVLSQGNKASKPLIEKIFGGCGGRRNSRPHRTDPQGPRMYTNPPTWESAPERRNLLVCSRGSD